MVNIYGFHTKETWLRYMERRVLVSQWPVISDGASKKWSVIKTGMIQGRRLYDRVSAHVGSGDVAHKNFRLEGFNIFSVSLW